MEEASASARAMARTVRDMFVALVAEGFSSKEALVIIGQMLAGAMKGQSE